MQKGLAAVGITSDAVLLVEDTTRESANALMTGNGYIDLLIPRGGKGLIQACVKNATVPCIETGTGICHIYVDEKADFEKALKIIENAKTGRPSVCNAAEVCLVNEKILPDFIPLLEKKLNEREKPVELRMDEKCLAFAKNAKAAGEGDFDTEFLDYILAVGAVKDVDEAIAHIAIHSTGHSEAIITEDASAVEKFVNAVDSAAVYINASTRFTDGGEFGLGCEMGISTQKLHARGPMGLAELNTYKYVVRGSGHIR
ncbi:MAG: glutamate-5-semialdehyde dehydrogenase, partial [Clostridia bacterium]|nr:glutamate-5-semialdehyde dehydrogenase [Clostridia bacterium]